MNWSIVTSVITAFTAVCAVIFTGLSLSATEQGQITDRYTKAIDQIGTQGPDHLQTRLGGVYTLERLARDSPRDQPTIIEVLSAFIRGGLPQHNSSFFNAMACPAPAVPFGLDTRAALTVLSRRNHDHDQGTVTDLQHTCLTGADLIDMNLTGANLTDADLEGADMISANLADADLVNVRLASASLVNANLTRANLNAADLTKTSLTGATLIGATLLSANLTGTSLMDADLTGATLIGVVHTKETDTTNARKDGAQDAWW